MKAPLTSNFFLLTSYFLCASIQAQQVPADQQPVFRGGTSVVRIDVIATGSDGQPVVDLQPEDFELSEDGTAQTIQSFKLVQVNPGWLPGLEGAPRPIRTSEDEAREAARDDVRLIGIFLDDYHVRRDPSLWGRQQLAEFAKTALVPSDMVGVMYPLDPIGAVRFTRNHETVGRELGQFLGRKGDYEPTNDIERGYVWRLRPPEIEQIRYEVSLSALKALIIRLGGLKQGRKSLMLISEGYSRPPVDLLMDLRAVYELANRNNVSIYGVDIRGLIGPMFGGPTEALRMLALATDGDTVINRNEIAIAMRQTIQDANAYYLLGYATSAPADGKFHDVRVRVRRPGIRLRYRDGYWAPTPEEVERLTTRTNLPGPSAEVEAALASVTANTRARTVRTWVGAERGSNGRTRLTFVWETLADARVEPVAAVSVTAVGGDSVPYFRGRVGADSRAGGGQVSFDAAPGSVQLRFIVEGKEGEALDSDAREIAVPDLTGSGPLFATPMVFRARLPRDVQEIRNDPRARPTASREFFRSERLLVRVIGYAGDSPAGVAARLINRAGQMLRELPVDSTDHGGFLDLALASLEPGDYVLEFAATSGDRSIREFVGFRVVV